jgi:hypothetical protein
MGDSTVRLGADAIQPLSRLALRRSPLCHFSTRLEMGVTDWENRGNLVFYHHQPGDVEGDGCVNDTDLLRVLFAFGQSGDGLPEDLDLNGIVNDSDLLRVLCHFGEGC